MAAIKRVRQHVNPLSNKYSTPAIAPDWHKAFENPHLPLHLDIGCAKGDFVRAMAHQCPDWNFLGLEIRAPLVERSLMKRDRDHQNNLHFIFCNANNSLKPVLANYPGGLHRVSIQFPDPWFKKRHQKRRVVQPELVSVLAELMIGSREDKASEDSAGKDNADRENAGRTVWLQSDIESVCVEMCDRFDEHAAFSRDGTGWLRESPFVAQTDRERVTGEKGLPVYRARYFLLANP